jgi:hypothetical protein
VTGDPLSGNVPARFEPGPFPVSGPSRLQADPGPASRLLGGALYYTDEELVAALRARRAELDARARQLEEEVLEAQSRLGQLLKEARARAEGAEKAFVAALLPRAREEAAAIVRDARQRASELGLPPGQVLQLDDIGDLLVTHFALEEELVSLVAESLQAGASRRLN